MLTTTSTRRDSLILLLPALAAMAASPAEGADLPSLKSVTYRFEDLPSKPSGQNVSHAIFDGLLHSGFRIEAHETELGPGGEPHPPHHHQHEEMMMIVNGTLDFTVNGKTTRLGPGGLGFAGSNDEHGVKNPSTDSKARYFVVAFGPTT